MPKEIEPAAATAESRMILSLKSAQPAARGLQCLVYIHPEDPCLLIKVPCHPAETGEPWYKRFRDHYAAQLREMAEYRKLEANAPADLDLIEPVIGVVETDFGPALAVRALRDRAGQLAPTILELVQQRRFDSNAREQLEQFLIRIIASELMAHDFKARNIVLAYDPASDRDRFVLVDGIGQRPDFSVDRFSRRLSRFNKIRRARRLRAEIRELAT